MTNSVPCVIVHSETKINYSTERTYDHEEHLFRYLLYERVAGYLPAGYSYSEARPFQDKQKNMLGLVS